MSRSAFDVTPTRRALAAGALLLTAAFSMGCGPDSDGSGGDVPGATRPNVLLISIDSLRADHLGCYGYERDTSPAIDALAAAGVLFECAVSQAPWTLPSHASLLTSLYGRTHQTNAIEKRLPPTVPTLAGTLEADGYETAGVVSGTFMQKRFGLDSGFGWYDDEIAQFDHKRSHEAVTSPDIHRKAESILDGVEEPFMLFLHYWDVHYDYDPPAPYDTKFDPGYKGKLDSKNFIRSKRIHPEMPARGLQHVVALYDGEIAWVDQHIGQLMAALESRGLDERTIVVLTADHGDEFFEHGNKGHSHSLYDELVHVPLIVRGPGALAGHRVPEPVELIDVMPTVLDLVGTPAPGGLQGRSLRAALLGEALPSIPVFTETNRARTSKAEPWSFAWSVRDGSRKYHEFLPGPEGGEDRPPEMYDLATDPGEQTDLWRDGDDLAGLLKAWRDRVPLGTSVTNAGVDEATMDELKKLGYAGDDK